MRMYILQTTDIQFQLSFSKEFSKNNTHKKGVGNYEVGGDEAR